MTHETQTAPTPEQPTEIQETAWLAFKLWTGSEDIEWFQAAHLGHWPNRTEFGRHLAGTFGAYDRLARLPHWLQPYVQLDGDRIAGDFEHAGHFHIVDLPDDGGCHVFDTYR